MKNKSHSFLSETNEKKKKIKTFSQNNEIKTNKRKSVKPPKTRIKVFSKTEKYHIIKISNLN